MNGTARLNVRMVEAANRINETQMLHPRKWKRHGEIFIKSINKGQAPRILAVGPRVVGGLKKCYLNNPRYDGVPGTVFEVTTMNDGTFDNVGAGSVFYAVKHLGIRIVDVWGNGNKTQAKTIENLKKVISEPLELREVSIFGNKATNVREADAVVVSCSDSRVQVHDIYEGVIVVSNAGNILSLSAIEVMVEAIEKGIPAFMILGHTKCGAVGAAVSKNKEPELAEIMGIVEDNITHTPTLQPEVLNAFVSASILKGQHTPPYAGAELKRLQEMIRSEGACVMSTFFDLATGEVWEI